MSAEPGIGGVPEIGTLTENEIGWITFIRLISKGRDPAPGLRAVQALRGVLNGCAAVQVRPGVPRE